jgi:hypothetical protein
VTHPPSKHLVAPAVLFALVGCSSNEVDSQLAAWNEESAELAKTALQALGADVDGAEPHRCQSCHAVSRAKLREWLELTNAAIESGCTPKSARRYLYAPRDGDPSSDLAELNPDYVDPASDAMTEEDARKLVDCMRMDPTNPSSPFDPSRVGIESISAHERNSHYARLFKKAYGEQEAEPRTELVRRVKMPRGAFFEDTVPSEPDPSYTVAIKKEDFWAIREWFDRGLPNLDEVLKEAPPPSTCTPSIRNELREHLVDNTRKGWTFQNAQEGVAMFGCESETIGWPDSALECLNKLDAAVQWPAEASGAAAGATIRVLRKLDYRTSFWMRSSADGRFIGNGRSDASGSVITDLETGTNIPIKASYDPGFLPDNSTFVFQGTPVGAGFCPQDMLLSPPMADGQLTPITFSESGCSGTKSIKLYQHLGTALDGGVSFAVNGDYSSDNGGQRPSSVKNPSATAGPNAKLTITPIVRHGTGYEFMPAVTRTTPYEGDTVISPTSRVISARIAGPGGEQLGFALRQVTLVSSGSGYTVALSDPSTVCVQGGKPAHSYDDRFMAVHSYSDAGGGVGKADIFVIDLSDGEVYPVTNMPAGAFALYPHFRSDGWLYFLVRDTNPADPEPNVEYAAASDLALRVEKAKPVNSTSW